MSKELQPGQPCEVLLTGGWRARVYIGPDYSESGPTGQHVYKLGSGFYTAGPINIRPILSRDERIEAAKEEALQALYAVACNAPRFGPILDDFAEAVCDAAREEETG